ncbi:nuclear transport factor 2 family protein [Nocardia sp. NPDC057353]|uniref:nuclear transport factor 2 family protein n=1 Tax=Nocardia sp. NPDC057353 TaxID=3346104 RepID=UPI003625CAEA
MAARGTIDGLYAEVSQFYAEQMQALDAGKFAAYAETFTDDATFSHTPGREPARTRAGILQDLLAVNERFADDPQQRRHMFTMMNLDPQSDGTIRSTVYALVLTTRPGAGPELVRTCVVHDVLARVDGALLNRARRVELDGLD